MSRSLSSSPNGLSTLDVTIAVASSALIASSNNASMSSFSRSNSRSSSGGVSVTGTGSTAAAASSPIKTPNSRSSFCAKSDASSNTGSLNCSTSDVDDEFKMIFSPKVGREEFNVNHVI